MGTFTIEELKRYACAGSEEAKTELGHRVAHGQVATQDELADAWHKGFETGYRKCAKDNTIPLDE